MHYRTYNMYTCATTCMAVASGPAGPVLVGPVLTLAFKTARAQGLMGVASRELLRLNHIASPVGGGHPPFIPALRLRDLQCGNYNASATTRI